MPVLPQTDVTRRAIVARVRGGLGNQLFIYATARALALRNDAQLWLDTHSVYAFDARRTYRLDHFTIEARIAPLTMPNIAIPRWRRTPRRWFNRVLPYSSRRYIEQPWLRFVPELTQLRLRHDIYLDGFWQSEAYFADQAARLRQELQFRAAPSPALRPWVERISAAPAVAVHVRRTDSPVFLTPRYYANAAARFGADAARLEYFVFADDRAWARETLRFPGRTTIVDRSASPDADLDDFRLMAQCRHFITANSTFSWWAAWLGRAPNRRVFTPAPNHEWGSATQIPATWEQVPLV